MLIDEIITFCDNDYKSECPFINCGRCNDECTHPVGCPHNCETCLEQVHYPGRHTNGRLDYDCDNILNFYVCKYMCKYSSEIEYALHSINKITYMSNMNVLSLGSGASPDLMAIENYLKRNMFAIPVRYLGIDINKRWEPLNEIAKKYFANTDFNVNYLYDDVIDIFKDRYADKMNMLIMQYLISHFYNTGKLDAVKDFYNRLIKNVIKYMQENSVIIINDVNSNRRGRDLFLPFSDMLNEKRIKHKYTCRYFEYNIQNKFQEYGIVYPNNNVLIWPKSELARYSPWQVCSSAQLIIELE